MPFIDAVAVASLLTWDDAIAALAGVLEHGLDLAELPPRSAVSVRSGQLLMMPAESAAAVGFKLLSVAPSNPAAGHPRIQALYVLMDAETLTPQLLLDGTALTTMRTPALSAFAVRHLAAEDADRLVVFGSGPQAEAHVHALASVRPITQVTIVSRNASTAQTLVQRLRGQGLPATTGTADALDDAELVVCATSARVPLFPGTRLAEPVCVVAIGSHEPDARELGDDVFARAARVVVEDQGTALAEAGDIVQAMMIGALTPERLVPLADITRLTPAAGLTVFKSVGMGWEDLAVAEAIAAAYRRQG